MNHKVFVLLATLLLLNAACTPSAAPTQTQTTPEALLLAIEPVCDRAHFSSASNETLGGTFLAAIYHPNGTSEYLPLPHIGAQTVSDVQTAVCIHEGQELYGHYTDGSPAYAVTWSVQLVRWSDGTSLDRESFTGGPPPYFRTGSGSRDGEPPFANLLRWLLAKVNNTSVIVLDDYVSSIDFSPDGQMIAVGTADGNITLWDPVTRNRVQTLESANYSDEIRDIALSPDGQTIASLGDEVILWDIETGEELRQIDCLADNIAISIDGRFLACDEGSASGVITLRDITTGQNAHTLDTPGTWNTIEFSPDGEILASGVCEWDGGCIAGDILLWDTNTWQVLATLTGHTGYFYDIEFSPDSKVIASSACVEEDPEDPIWCIRDEIRLWDSTTGELIRVITGNDYYLGDLAFVLDGTILASTGYAGRIELWDTTTGEHLRTLSGHLGGVTIASSPDGTALASGGDYTVRVWDMRP